MPFFKLRPKMDALTTDETCEVVGAQIFRDWYNMRFAQRQILMCSIGLSRRVLTLNGRMSAFRSSVSSNPEFIRMVEAESRSADRRVGKACVRPGRSRWWPD